jgi:2-polyprenyl-3-methyl-5-hydroxy-6-metoxy-1,4-benzoquinol methylase
MVLELNHDHARQTVSRIRTREVFRVFNELWNDPNRPPWDVRSTPIEQKKLDLLAPHLDKVASVIDCACGGGDFLDLLCERASFEHVVGIDVAEQALVRAKRTGRYHDLYQSRIDEAHLHVSRRFDLVLVSEVLMYLDDYETPLAYAAEQLLAPGGLLFVSVALGREYFDAADVKALKRVAAAAGLQPVVEQSLDYEWLGMPRKDLPFSRAFAQTHKVVLIHRAP